MVKTVFFILTLTIGLFAQTPIDELKKLELTKEELDTSTPVNMKKPEIPAFNGELPSEKICSSCTKKDYDKVTDTTTIFGRDMVVSKNRKSGFIVRSLLTPKNTIVLSFGLVGVNPCIDAKTQIHFLFRDKTRITTHSSNSIFDCEGSAPIYFGGIFGNYELLRNLQTKEIETVRVHTYRSSIQQDFSNSQSIKLMTQLKCLDKSIVEK